MNQMRIIEDITELVAKVSSLEYENRELKDRKSIDATRFYASALNVESVASLHGVHPDTVRKYIQMGCIEKHPDSTDAKILIRASTALTLDFKELKRKPFSRIH